MGNSHKQKNEKSTIKSNYFPTNGYKLSKNRLEPIARIILMGVYDDNNPLSQFRGMRYIIKEIWSLAIQFNKHYYSKHIEIKDKPHWGWDEPYEYEYKGDIGFTQAQEPTRCYTPKDYYKNHIDYTKLQFPKPLKKEININMMPIEMSFDKNKLQKQLPTNLYGYIDWIRACLQCDPSQRNKICFLTIHESYVKKGRTQRRPGVHIEFPGKIDGVKGNAEWQWAGWGGGYKQTDGIFMANNIDNSCVVWNCKVTNRYDNNDESYKNVIGDLGNLQHIKTLLPQNEKYILKGNTLYWITDTTPHESLPMEKSGYRQFFRLVSSKLGIWYKQHSTENPNGIKPDIKITKVVKYNKFKKK